MKLDVRPQDFICRCLPVKRQQKAPEGVPREALRKVLADLDTLRVGRATSEDLPKALEQLKCYLQSLDDIDANHPFFEDTIDMVESLLKEDIFLKLAENLEVFDISTRTVAVNLCCVLLQNGLPGGLDKQVQDEISKNHRLMQKLLEACHKEEIATHAGFILRSCLKHEAVAKEFMKESQVLSLFALVKSPAFEVSTDAFNSLRDVLLVHRRVAAEWLLAHKSEFFRRYNELLEGEDYVVKRQALKLLSELLLDKHYQKVMLWYVGEERHLRLHMNLLRDSSKMLSFEAFHIFKLFAANPQKPLRVQKILCKNQRGLIELIDKLQSTSSTEDEQFIKDKTTIMQKLQALSCSVEAPVPLAVAKVQECSAYPASNASTGAGSTPSSADTTGSGRTSVAPSRQTSRADIDNFAPVCPIIQSL